MIEDIPDMGGVTPYGARESVKEAASSYQNVLQEVFKNKNTPGLEEAFRGEEIKVSPAGEDGYNLKFQIGDMTFNYPQDVEGYEAEDFLGNRMTATSNKYDEYSDIWPQIKIFIDKAIESKKGRSRGGSNKKKLPGT